MADSKNIKITPENMVLPTHKPDENVWAGISESLEVAAATGITAADLPQHSASPAIWNNIARQLPHRGLFLTGSYLFTLLFAFLIIMLSQMSEPTPVIATNIPVLNENFENSPENDKQAVAFASPEREIKKTTTTTEKEQPAKTIINDTVFPVENETTTKETETENHTIENAIPLRESKAQTASYSENPGSVAFRAPALSLFAIAQKESPSSFSLQSSEKKGTPIEKKKGTMRNLYLRAGAAKCFSAIKAFEEYKFHNGFEYSFLVGYRKKNMLFETGLLYTDITYDGMHVLDYYQYEFLGTVIHIEAEETITISQNGDTIRKLSYTPVLKDIYDSVNLTYDDELENRIKYLQIPVSVGKDLISSKKFSLSGMAGVIWSIPVSQSAIELYNPDGHIKINENKVTVPLQVRSRLMLNGEVIFRYHINRYIRPYASMGFRYGKNNAGYEMLYPDSGEFQGLLKAGVQIHF